MVPLDSKANPQEALNALKQRPTRVFATSCRALSAVVAIIRWGRQAQPAQSNRTILYLNHAAVDPALTNERCNLAFRFDADADMKMQALTNYMMAQKNIKFIPDQPGLRFRTGGTEERARMLAKKRPDIKIVGDDPIRWEK